MVRFFLGILLISISNYAFSQFRVSDENRAIVTPIRSDGKQYAYNSYLESKERFSFTELKEDSDYRISFSLTGTKFLYDLNEDGALLLFQILERENKKFDEEKWVESNIGFKKNYKEISGSLEEIYNLSVLDNYSVRKSKSYKDEENGTVYSVAQLERNILKKNGEIKNTLSTILTVIGKDSRVNFRDEAKKVIITSFGGRDLKDDNILYYLEEYAWGFLFDISNPRTTNFSKQIEDKYYFSRLNSKDSLFLDQQITKIVREGFPAIEFKDLPDNIIAVADGNLFEDGYFKILIDPIKFKNASPEKRAYIFWHEGFHSLGLDHGQCGKMMFPYAEKEYSWRQWSDDKAETIKCWIEKRNNIQKLAPKNERIDSVD